MDDQRPAITPESALEILKTGNSRFLTSAMTPRDPASQVKNTAGGAKPFAVVLTCCDSRIPPEHIFDVGLGEIFSVRIAGNVLSRDGLGTMEFACQLGGAKLVVIMGHTSCGAVKGACDGVELENFSWLLSKFDPAIQSVEETGAERGAEFNNQVAEKNVSNVIASTLTNSETLRSLVADGQIGIVGAMYSVQTGVATFGQLVCGSAS